MKPKRIERYTVIVYTGGYYFLFPDKWLFRKNKAIFCPQDVDTEAMISSSVIYCKHQHKYIHIAGSIFWLWREKMKLKKESKHKYYRQKAIFTIYFWKGLRDAWRHGEHPKYYKRYKQLQLLDRKVMTVGTFLKYFSARTEKEGSLAWECRTKKHFKRRIPVRRELDKGYISKKLSEAISFIEGGKTVHITKMKSLNRLGYLHGDFDGDVFYGFARVIANNILSYYLAGGSLCVTEDVPKERKERILRQAVSAINGCFGESCDIDTHAIINGVFDEIDEMIDTKRLYVHAARVTPRDPDLLAIKECLGYFINDKNKYPGFWKREYDIAKYYCVSYSDMRFRLQVDSVPRINDILEFVDAYIGTKGNAKNG